VSEHTSSTSRRKRLKQSLSNIYDRLSSGVHNNIAPEEAQSIFLQTYLYLGEVVTLGKDSPASESDESISVSEEA
jgi:hypothetical protein